MHNVSEEMKHLHKLAKRDPSKRFDHLWELLPDPRWLMQAWEEIRSNQGSMTAGIDSTIATDMPPERIQQLAERLKIHRYRPKPVRRVSIANANGKMRPLGIPTLEDRIVQQALRMLMEPIFEADFYTCSHGFRRHRRTHTALRDVARMYPRTTWIIEGDIVGGFGAPGSARRFPRVQFPPRPGLSQPTGNRVLGSWRPRHGRSGDRATRGLSRQ